MTTATIQDQLTPALDALVIHSQTAFTFAGRPFSVTPAPPQNMNPHPTPSDPLTRELQMAFYMYCYSRRFTGSLPELPAINSAPGQRVSTTALDG